MALCYNSPRELLQVSEGEQKQEDETGARVADRT
jgi:hypothetical protein